MRRKRVHKRIKVRSTGELIGRGENGTGLRVRVGGIGLGGVEIFSESQLVIGEPLQIRVTFLSKRGKNLEGTFAGELRWMIPYNRGYLGGIQFDRVIGEDYYPELFECIVDIRKFTA